MIWGAAQVRESVGGTVDVIGNDFDPQKSLQDIGAITAAGCEGCIFTWFPDSPAFTKTFVEKIGDAGGAKRMFLISQFSALRHNMLQEF